MLAVYFEDRFSERRLLGKVGIGEPSWNLISNFMREHNYKAPYIRSWEENGETWYDVGSHSEFFVVVEE